MADSISSGEPENLGTTVHHSHKDARLASSALGDSQHASPAAVVLCFHVHSLATATPPDMGQRNTLDVPQADNPILVEADRDAQEHRATMKTTTVQDTPCIIHVPLNLA
jgi:hypothetical protein